jgi:hypothetical protein
MHDFDDVNTSTDRVESGMVLLLAVFSETVVDKSNFVEDCMLTSELFLDVTNIIGEDDC